jgi:CHAT domain-containing protein/tetratricopeptide (TPR) repeat protein
MSGKERDEVSRAERLHREARQLEGRGRYRQAEKKWLEVLEIKRKVLGEEHPDTANSYQRVALCLGKQGKHADALRLHNKALAIRLQALGEEHPETAFCYSSVGVCLLHLGKPADALPLCHKALAIQRKTLGEDHPHTATCYNDLAGCLMEPGKLVEAHPLYEKALAIRQKALGKDHPDTAASYDSLATCLARQGKHADALPLYEKALAISRQVSGEESPITAHYYDNMAHCLNAQGQHGKAMPLHEKALTIYRKTRGEEHPDTALACHNVAGWLDVQGNHRDALLLFKRAQAINCKVLGEEHLLTVHGYSAVAVCLSNLGKHADALPLFNKTLAIRLKVLGELHPDTAQSYNNLAMCLYRQDRYADALPLLNRALTICKKVRGEEHPDTALACNNVVLCLAAQGKWPEAVRLLQASLPGQEAARFHAAASGFDRAVAARHESPHAMLAVGLARLKQPSGAFRHAEAALARGLLDDLAHSGQEEAQRIATLSGRLRTLDASLVALFARGKLSIDQERQRQDLARLRRAVMAELSRLASAVSARQLASLEDIRSALPADAALVLWLDWLGPRQHWACVLRRLGPPAWVEMPGTGQGGAWSAADLSLPDRLYRVLLDPTSSGRQRDTLVADLRKQRLGPLLPYLQAQDRIPAVTQLFVVPTGHMAYVPVEVLAPEYRVVYVPSGSLLARLKQKHRPLQGHSLLALGDPVFTIGPPPEPPDHGVLLTVVPPGSNAARAGLQASDVLLSVGKKRLESADDLTPALSDAPASALYWRDGKKFVTRLSAGPLGAVVDQRSARAAVRALRRQGASLVQRGTGHQRLPGTRLEVESLARLVPSATTLLGSAASEQELDRLQARGKLKEFRLLHFATHGAVDEATPDHSRLILAQDRLPRPEPGHKLYTGELTVQAIRQRWQLGADLVVLSACQTALGKSAGGEGLLGFAQAFLSRGARSVVLSRWKVDDTATALLMVRFYENFLGKRAGLKRGLARAEALAEAKKWLAGLKRKRAEALAAKLSGGVLRGSEGDERPLVKGKPARLPEGDRPFAHPFYWAAFVLVGDPD